MQRKAGMPFAGCCFIAAIVAAIVPLLSALPAPSAAAGFPGWPTQFEGKPLRGLPLTALEKRFEENFPGRIGRFSDGEREIILRWVAQETRKLHPAIDCFKGSGYAVTPQPIEVDSSGTRWGSFRAARGAEKINVRERIYDAAGNEWTDVSAWYWAAMWQKSSGPWWAVTLAQSQRRH